jgi:murein DD-endopeptidase MepM/ murein hydrolase activator NlpD
MKAAEELSGWMQNTFRGTAGYAGGGKVEAGMFGGDDMTKIVAKSLEETISSKVDAAIKELQKQLMLKEGEKETSQKKTGPDGEDGEFEVGAAGNSGDALTMARNLMRDLGLTADQAAGIVGNMVAESGVENARPQNTPPGTKGVLKVDDVTGYGIVQWTSRGRQQALADYAKSKGADLSKPLSMDIEYQFFLKELKSDYASVLSQIKQAKDVKTASTIFMQQYEVPEGHKTEAKIMERYNKSKPIYDKLAKGEGKATEGPGTYIGDPDGVANVKGGKAFPLIKGQIGTGPSQVYGAPRDYGGHAGVDVVEKSPWGKDPRLPISAYSGGKVLSEKYNASDPYLSGLKIDHGKFQTRYLHATPSVRPGDTVQPGQKIGKLLNLGNQTHLHFEAYQGSKRLNPTNLLQSAYLKGGRVTKPTLATLAEDGRPEFVFDADTTKGLDSMAPLLLDRLNTASSKPKLMNVLQSYFGGNSQIAATSGGAAAKKQDNIQPKQDTQIAATYGEGFPKKNFMDFLEKDYQKNLKNPIKNNTNDDSRPSRANALPLAQKSLPSPQIASYTSYEQSYPSEVLIPIPVPVPVPTGGGNSSGSSGGSIIAMGGNPNPFGGLYKGC